MNKCESCVQAIKKMCSRDVSALNNYQPLEYILMTSGSYIDTGVSLTSGAIGEMKINILSGPLALGAGAKDDTTSNYNRNYFSFFYDSNLKRYVIGIGAGGYNNVWTDYTFNTVYTVSFNTPGHSYVLNGTSYTYTGSKWKDARNPPYARWTWALHGGTNASTGAHTGQDGNVIVYYCKLCDHNGVLKRDLHPMIRKSDNVVGMYDTVSGAFFTNAGTGEFTVGADIE